MSYLYSKLPETGVSPHIGTGGLRASVELGALKDAGLPAGRSRGKRPEQAPSTPPRPSAPSAPELPSVNKAVLRHIDKSALMLGEPRRYRDRAHLEFVSAQPCVLCGRRPSDAHHLRFMQPRALGRRVSDEFTVPLCRTHHRALHRHGDEAAWWASVNLNPAIVAQRLWQQTRLKGAPGHGSIHASPSAPVVEDSEDKKNESAGRTVDTG
jgi:hypothetical protein